MTKYIQTNQTVVIPATATYLVSANDTGKILLISAQAAGCIITLPAAQIGLRYRFILTAPAGGIVQIGTGVVGGLGGVGVTANSVVPVIAANLTVRFAATATFGDFIDVTCISSTKWSVNAASQVNAGIVVA